MKNGTREDWFIEKIAMSTDCWTWQGKTADNGYGHFTYRHEGKPKTMLSHRYAYIMWVGPIPEGMYLDHLCCNKACVRPEHLEPVTPAENNARHYGKRAFCKNGHEMTEANTIIPKASPGQRKCRECRRRIMRQNWERRRHLSTLPSS